jgi:hypothetical protein
VYCALNRVVDEHISLLGCSDEGFHEAALLSRTHGARRPSRYDAEARVTNCRVFASSRLKDVTDLSVRVIERFPENIRSALSGREFLEQ